MIVLVALTQVQGIFHPQHRHMAHGTRLRLMKHRGRMPILEFVPVLLPSDWDSTTKTLGEALNIMSECLALARRS